ncbi:PDZ domain-containing protein [Leptotrichia sp. OH3620_COT-345]|uniref:S1C family serine protease n=1 Tax=Leptotrichia sp. OH3620_COT-345 TaxID=2491048 RepID=UPI000F64BF8A|nr:trypsin-like peptidase domain-containing protein [Leptotrichia sp. OH3620_COT-345]RRD38471.1 PDZ domain-containing protein [Leptotrichia sp. OH3620_COT-345]
MKRNKLLIILSLLTVLSCFNPLKEKSGEIQEVEKKETVSQKEQEKHTKNALETQDAFINVYKNSKDSIVNIRTKKTITVNTYNPLEELLFGRSGGVEKRESGSLGSGFVVSEDGYIVTNNHVVNNADEIYVKFTDGKEYLTKLVGTSPEVDIAVLKIESNEKFKPLEFTDSDKIEIGQWSIAFGNPLGLNDSMTVGIVSAAGRSSLGIEQIENFIQTDAAINQGNSGGPLVDINGKVIGVNTAILSTSGGSIGLGFAIPSNLASVVKDSIISTGKFEKPYIGIYLENLTSEKMQILNIKSGNGVYIAQIVPNSPAERAGIKAQDVITAVNEKPVNSAGAFIGELAAKKAGQTVTLKVIRNSQTLNIPVILEPSPKIQQ